MKILKLLGPLGWLIDPISKVANEIAKWKQKEADAKTEAERIAAQERIRTLEIRQSELARDPFAPLIRAAFAFPFVIYINKLVLWDKVMKLGTTDPLTGVLPGILSGIVTFYFLSAVKNLWGRK